MGTLSMPEHTPAERAATASPGLAGLEGLEPGGLAPALPRLLISFLERRYLGALDPAQWDMHVGPDDDMRPLLREITAAPRAARSGDAEAMPYVLSASHTLGQAVVFATYGDGRRHKFFIGGRRLPGGQAGSTQDFLDGQAAVLQAQLPGIEYGPVRRLDGDDLPELTSFLATAPAVAAVTGIPALRPGSADRVFQSIDRLTAAAGPHRYALLTVAEPLASQDLDETLDRLRELKSETHALVRRTISRAHGETTSDSSSRHDPNSRGSNLPLALTGFAAFCSVAGFIVPGAQMLGALASPALYGGSMLRMQSMANQATVSTTTGQTDTVSGTTEFLDATAEACERLLQQHIDRLEAARSGGWWRTSVFVAAESTGALAAVTGALRAIGSGATTALDPIRVIPVPPWLLRPALSRGQTVELRPAAQAVRHPLGRTYEALATCMSTDELAVLNALPRREVPGFRLTEAAEFALTAPPAADDAVGIGDLLDSAGHDIGAVALTGPALNRHVFITGMTGYGKTNTAMRLLAGARRTLGVPFFVIEPVKGEYRRLRDAEGLGDLRVYSIGGDDVALPLRLNPFAPIAGVPLMRHIDLLKAVFNASFPMFAGMSYVLEEAILEIYADRGWDLRTSANRALGARASAGDLAAMTPSIADLHDKIEVVLDRKRYGQEIHQNMGAALRSRLGSLMVGAKGEAVNCRRSVAAEDLFTTPCVIELRNLGDDEEKSFVMALLLCMLYEYAEARQGSGIDGLQHLTLIEEAHRLLRAPRPSGGAESADAQAKAVVMFTDMLAEMRAYGEGFVVADQVPAKLSPDVVKNSNVKIVHRLVAPDDRAVVAASMNLSDAQSRHLVTLRPGDAVVHDSDMGAAVLVRVRREEARRPAAVITEPARRDDSYLRRNGGCARCPDPCAFLGTVGRYSDDDALDEVLAPFFPLLLSGDGEAAWNAWAAWRATWDGDQGSAYCAVTQAGNRWLGRLMAARAQAVAKPGPAAGGRSAGPAPADLLRQDKAAREIAALVGQWLTASEFDAAARQDLGTTRDGLRALLTTQPPRELPGCAACPARCQYLPVVAPRIGTIGTAAGHRASAATPAATRLRALQDLLGQHPDMTAGLDGDAARNLLYCLVTVTSARSGTDPSELLQAITDKVL
jgi:DNA helicase HerA-like ATPase